MALTVANVLLALAVIAGTVLALWHMRATTAAQRPPLAVGIAHGLVGTAGFVALLLALRGPPRGVASGAAQFGTMAAVLFGLALLAGVGVLLVRRRAAATIAIHAGLAIGAYVLFLAWGSLG